MYPSVQDLPGGRDLYLMRPTPGKFRYRGTIRPFPKNYCESTLLGSMKGRYCNPVQFVLTRKQEESRELVTGQKTESLVLANADFKAWVPYTAINL